MYANIIFDRPYNCIRLISPRHTVTLPVNWLSSVDNSIHSYHKCKYGIEHGVDGEHIIGDIVVKIKSHHVTIRNITIPQSNHRQLIHVLGEYAHAIDRRYSPAVPYQCYWSRTSPSTYIVQVQTPSTPSTPITKLHFEVHMDDIDDIITSISNCIDSNYRTADNVYIPRAAFDNVINVLMQIQNPNSVGHQVMYDDHTPDTCPDCHGDSIITEIKITVDVECDCQLSLPTIKHY